jgi:RNA polymerase sigma factor (sigma-70 family)
MLDKVLVDAADLSNRPSDSDVFESWSDGRLLEWFVRQRAETAFTALVRRHGPMVFSVCNRVLRHKQDAEDAFQATFLVLARKAERITKPELLANWLYGVAYRTALHARNRNARCRQRELEAASMTVPPNQPEEDSRELTRLLDEELHRLPEKYRVPLVLCYLEGKTHQEAARLLGWPSGSMSSRLARGRAMLRDRLTGRLRALSGLLLPAYWDEWLQPATVPPFLAEATVQAALGLLGVKALASGLISASVRDLMEAAVDKPQSSWLKWLVALVLLLLIVLSLSMAISHAGWLPQAGGGGCPAHATE